MKKLLAMLLAVLMVLSTVVITIMAEGDSEEQPTVDVWDGTTSTAFTNGTGAENDPYLIESAANLRYLADLLDQQNDALNVANSGNHFKLTTDIDLKGHEWIPIGASGAAANKQWFDGYFDGDGHTVYNVVTAESRAIGGLFGCAFGVIENLKVAGESRLYGGGGGAGGIVGGVHPIGTGTEYDMLTIRNCETGEDVEVRSATSGSNRRAIVGGIVGYAYTKGTTIIVEKCINRANVYLDSSNSKSFPGAGGIVGMIRDGSVTNCVNFGAISSNISKAAVIGVGGIVGNAVVDYGDGYADSIAIRNVINYGSLTGTNSAAQAAAGMSVGGVLGYVYLNNNTEADSISIENTYSLATTISASVTSESAQSPIAGLVFGAVAAGTNLVSIKSATVLAIDGVAKVGDEASVTIEENAITVLNSADAFNEIEAYHNILFEVGLPSHTYNVSGYDEADHWEECACGAVKENTTVAHDFSKESNDTHHWDECACGYVNESTREEHDYDSCDDTVCNVCEAPREAVAHEYDSCDDTVCNVCEAPREAVAHEYDSCDDTVCNVCEAPREAVAHEYDSCDDTICNVCEAPREAVAHEYDSCEDTECNNCPATREPETHDYDNDCDAICNKCNDVREGVGHEYSVREYDATSHWMECSKCGAIDEETRVGHNFSDDNDTDCECGYVRNVCDHEFTDYENCGDGHMMKCALCGAVDEETRVEHAYTVPNKDEATHYTECVCGAIDESTRAEHDFVVPKKDANQHWIECMCGAIDGEKTDHYYAEEKKDAAQHWGECACGATSVRESHKYTDWGTNDAEHWGVCSICETPNASSKTAHVFGEWTEWRGVFSRSCVCGYTEYAENAPTTDDTTAGGNDDVTTEPEGDVTTEPEDVTTEPETDPETEPVTEPSDNETEEPKKDGCGSVVGGTAALVALALILPAAFAVKKKDEE